STVTVNQQQDGSQWVLLGTFSFDAGTAGSVLVRTDGTTGYAVADAARFVRQTGGASVAGGTPMAAPTGLANLQGAAVGPTATGELQLLSEGGAVLAGTGNGFGETDELYFAQTTVTGDFVASARIQSLASDGPNPLVGLMVREDLAADARFVALATSLGEQYQAAWYRLDGETLVQTELVETYVYPDAWLALSRVGDNFALFTSADGVDWAEADTVTVPGLADALHVGLFISSGTTGVDAQATISDFTVVPLDTAPSAP
ncbi:hypothetical protein HQ590_03655, partial [bacterium]|nr:hypothetical protein [bacterium]